MLHIDNRLDRPCVEMLSGNAALDVLRSAMTDAKIEREDRSVLIGYFCNRWNAAIAERDAGVLGTSADQGESRG